MNCKNCNKELILDFAASGLSCPGCGTFIPIAEVCPNYNQIRELEDIKKADILLSKEDIDLKQTGEAMMLYTNALRTSSLPEELKQLVQTRAKNGIDECKRLKLYISAKKSYSGGDTQRALQSFGKIRDYKDSSIYIEKCRTKLAKQTRQQLPLNAVIGLLMPVALLITLSAFKVKLLHCIIICLAVGAATEYFSVKGGFGKTVVIILTALFAFPFTLFAILTFLVHLSTLLSLLLAFIVPAAVLFALASLDK